MRWASWSTHSTETRSAWLVAVLDGDTVCMVVGVALGKLVHVLDGDTVCVAVGAALGKLVDDVLDGDTVCLHHDK